MADGDIKFEDLRKLLDAAKTALAAHPDVVQVGLGEKRTDGVLVGTNALVAFVENKLAKPTHPLPQKLRLPLRDEMIEAPLDIEVAARNSRRMINRRLDGADVLVSSVTGRTGTLGVVVRDGANGQILYGVTNAHVVTAPNQTMLGARVSAIVAGVQRPIGKVSHQARYATTGGNATDVALVELSEKARAFARAYAIDSIDDVKIEFSAPLSASGHAGAKRRFHYSTWSDGKLRVVECAHPIELGQEFFLDESGDKIPFPRPFRLETVKGEVKMGDSGALLTRDRFGATGQVESLVACGMVLAGRGRDVYAFSWPDVTRNLRDLKVDLL